MYKPRKVAKKRTVNATPAVLPARYGQKHNRFVATGDYGGTLDSVSLSLSRNQQPSEYSISDLEGDIFRTLRRYGLLLARYQILDRTAFFKRYIDAGTESNRVLNIANRVVANAFYKDVYGDDPSIGTTHLAPLIQALKSPDVSYDVLLSAAAYCGTEAIDTILNSKIDPLVKGVLTDCNYLITDLLNPSSYHLGAIRDGMNTSDRYYRKWALTSYARVYRTLEKMERELNTARVERDEEKKRAKRSIPDDKHSKQKQPNGCTVLEHLSDDDWHTPMLAKPELSISHSGLLGRRLKPSNEGKFVRDLGRIISDPQQRIFGRKSKALGGVVVVDCSGSMSLTTDEMRDIMKASSGCTVISYSYGERDGAHKPNMWLLARMGRQTRYEPQYPGGNGVDYPALAYGLTHRRGNAPMVWVSDTEVVGRSGRRNDVLRKQCLDFCRKHNIYIAGNAHQATELLRRLQRGDRVINNTIPR